MYIPITVGSGIVTTEFLPKLSGELIANCEVEYGGSVYEPQVPVAIKRNNSVILRTSAEENKVVTLTLEGVTYTWYIHKPMNLQVVENGGFYKLKGAYTELSVGDRSLDLVEGEGNPDLFIPDFGNELLMTVDLETGKFKKVSVPGIIDAAASPKTYNDSVSFTICAVSKADTGGIVTVFDQNLNVLHTHEIATVLDRPGIMGVLGGRFYFPISTSSQATVTRYGSTLMLYTNHNYLTVSAGSHVIQVPSSGTGVFIQDETGYVVRAGLNLSKVTPSSLLSAHEFNGRIAIVDRVSGMLHVGMVNSGGFTGTYIGDQGAISSVLVTSDGILVGFFDEGIKRYVDGVMVEQVSESGTSFMVQEDELIATRLHDTDIVYNLTQQVTTLNSVEVKRNTQTSVSFQYSAEIGGPAELINSLGTVYVDGKAFDGILPPSCTVMFVMPPTANYYQFRKMGIVGASAYEWDVHSEPQLLVNTITLPPRYDAQIRTYEMEDLIISGITEGYFEEIYVTDPNVQLQVNGGEWSKSAIVTTKDVVLVRWYIDKYSSTYDPNIQIKVRRNGALLGTWYVLKMGLDGVYIPEEHRKDFNRTDIIVDENLPVLAPVTIGKSEAIVETVSLVSSDIYDPNVPMYVQSTSDVGTICTLSQDDLEGRFKVNNIYRTIRTDSNFIVPATYDLTYTETGVQPAYLYTITGTSSDVFDAANSYAQDLSVSTRHGAVSWAEDVTASVLDPTTVKSSSIDREVVLGTSNYFSENVPDRTYVGYQVILPSTSMRRVSPDKDIAPLYSKGVSSIPELIGVDTEGREPHAFNTYVMGTLMRPGYASIEEHSVYSVAPTTTEKLGTIISLGASISEWNSATWTSVGLFANAPIYRDFSTGVSTVKYRITEFAINFSQLNVTVFREFDVAPEVGRSNGMHQSLFGVGVTSVSEAELIATLGSVRTLSKLAEVPRVAEFRSTNFRGVTVGNGLFTYEEVMDELDKYSEGSLPVPVQVGDSYVIRTLQIEETPECIADQVPLGQRKTFGYLGGG